MSIPAQTKPSVYHWCSPHGSQQSQWKCVLQLRLSLSTLLEWLTSTLPGSNGANGGIQPTGSLSVPSVRLYPFLQSQYSAQALANICVLKIDTEGHDVVILADLPAQFRPPVIWVEWFMEYQFADIKTLLLEVSHTSDKKWLTHLLSQEKSGPKSLKGPLWRTTTTAPRNPPDCSGPSSVLATRYSSPAGRSPSWPAAPTSSGWKISCWSGGISCRSSSGITGRWRRSIGNIKYRSWRSRIMKFMTLRRFFHLPGKIGNSERGYSL